MCTFISLIAEEVGINVEGGAIVAKSINVEGGIFWKKKQVHNSNM